MVRPEQEKMVVEAIKVAHELKMAYRDALETYAIKDLMTYLKDCHETSLNIAGMEMENMDKKALYLQDAYVYGKVVAYITDKAS